MQDLLASQHYRIVEVTTVSGRPFVCYTAIMTLLSEMSGFIPNTPEPTRAVLVGAICVFATLTCSALIRVKNLAEHAHGSTGYTKALQDLSRRSPVR